MKGARLALAAAFVLLTGSAFAQTNIAGDWEITITSPQGPNTSQITFKQDGESVTGTFKSPMGELPFKGGTLSGNDLKFSFTIDIQGQSLEILIAGKVDGDAMKGTANFGGFADGDWTAKRIGAPAATAAAAPAAAAATTAPAASPSAMSSASGGAAGKWDVMLQTPQGEFPATATIAVDGGKLSGNFGSQMGEVPLTGTVEGKLLKFTMTAQTPQGDMSVAMTGELDGDSIVNGKADISGLGQLAWTAKRAKQ
ncbi:MAG: hypothetical protein HY048_05575 [Acidobacteria bacterium]|nr:hypothetical protein [Acidobacteriota bacterium]